MTDLNPGWLLGAAVNVALIASYIASLWASFSAAERILGYIDRWRHR